LKREKMELALLVVQLEEKVRNLSVSKMLWECAAHLEGGPALDWKVFASWFGHHSAVVNQNDVQGRTPLHLSVLQNVPVEVVHLLLAARPDAAKEKDKYGMTPLHLGVLNRSTAAVLRAMIISCSEATLEKDADGRTPLHSAIEKNAPTDVLRVLLAATPGALRIKGRGDRTALHYMMGNNAPPASVQAVLEVWPDAIKQTCDEGMTPLHYGLSKQAPVELVCAAMNAWPDVVHEKDGKGRTPLQVATESGASLEAMHVLSRGNHKCVESAGTTNGANLSSIILELDLATSSRSSMQQSLSPTRRNMCADSPAHLTPPQSYADTNVSNQAQQGVELDDLRCQVSMLRAEMTSLRSDLVQRQQQDATSSSASLSTRSSIRCEGPETPNSMNSLPERRGTHWLKAAANASPARPPVLSPQFLQDLSGDLKDSASAATISPHRPAPTSLLAPPTTNVVHGHETADKSLQHAAGRGDVSVVQELLATEAKPGILKNSAAPIHLAAQAGHVEKVAALLAAGADLAAATPCDGATALLMASTAGHTQVVQMLLGADADPSTARTDTGASALFTAAQGGHVETVQLLLAYGADANAGNTIHGRAPLWIAAEKSHIEIVEALISHGVDVSCTRFDDGSTPLW
jgi:ankyrin repeat protein